MIFILPLIKIYIKKRFGWIIVVQDKLAIYFYVLKIFLNKIFKKIICLFILN
jgi:hypothetical protein